MSNARDLMSSPVITVSETTSLAEAAQAMLDQRIGALVVVDQLGKLTGILTESDFAAKTRGVPFSTFRAPQVLGKWITEKDLEDIYAAARNTPVSEVMTRRVATAGEDDTIISVVQAMLEHDINRVPIVTDGRPVGIVARHDLLRLLAGRTERLDPKR